MTALPAIDPVLDPALDPALVGRELGPWYMVPWWASAPVAVVCLVLLAWYFRRLGGAEVPRERRLVRRFSILFAAVTVVALVVGLTVIHPHENRRGFALAWLAVSIASMACLLLAVLDVFLTTRRGVAEFRALRRETFGGGRKDPGHG